MNAWKREPKKNTSYMEQNHQHKTMYQSDSNMAVRSTSTTTDQRHQGMLQRDQRQSGSPTKLRVRTSDVEIQWLD